MTIRRTNMRPKTYVALMLALTAAGTAWAAAPATKAKPADRSGCCVTGDCCCPGQGDCCATNKRKAEAKTRGCGCCGSKAKAKACCKMACCAASEDQKHDDHLDKCAK